MKPKLRFKNYDKDWDPTTLQNISSKFDYGICASAVEFDGKHKYIRITDIDDISRKYMPNPIVSPDVIPDNRYMVKENDILFARTGATTGKTYLFDKNDDIIYFAGFLIRINIFNANPHFIFYKTLTKQYQHWINVTSIRSGQPGINAEELKKYKLYVPSIAEQNKIATFLNLYYKKIELQKQKIKELEKFSFDVLFNNQYQGKTVRLGDILSETVEKTSLNNQYEVVSSTKTGLYYQKDYFNKEIASENNIGYKILKLNQIVISPQNLWLGNINYNNKIEIGIVSPSYKIFDINSRFNKTFIAHLLKTKRAIYEYEISSEQGASIVRRNLNMELFYEITFKIPERDIQDKIAIQLDMLFDKVTKEKQKLELMEQYKQGLLQQMFV